MRRAIATRYVTPLREGGSLPAIFEADDAGLYVVKFRSAGQGRKALVAEVIAGELARAAGLRVPELIAIEVDPALGRNEPDGEIRDLLKASAGLNLGLDYLPGSITFDPVAGPAPTADDASAVVWLDAFVTNVDRTPRNPNLLTWHRQLWLIDHGASLYFQHAWDGREDKSRMPFPLIKDHVLLPWAKRLRAAHERLVPLLSNGAIASAVGKVPDEFLAGDDRFASTDSARAAYAGHLERRLAAAPLFLEEAERARA
jgi:hypothetical protein